MKEYFIRIKKINLYFNFNLDHQMTAVQFNYSFVMNNMSLRIGMIIFRQNIVNELQYPTVYKAARSATQEKKHKRHRELWNIIELGMFMTTLKETPGLGVIEINRGIK